ncbi:hypothetical protein OIDMADRAFT_29130 [Oidiodendron maius Zn]|uniref:Uncharacterized protein n=1 Tax=Oidiodendron maius (strain Zn) TaxID=913774 RepID=A0A0C3DHJ2_OIDMZ|nr:hypothetical protein OIDMADRAFT_29130 [Oidiodendron maius Zn]
MIRPAPSSIILGSGDLKQFEIRQRQYMQLKAERKSIEAGGHNSTPAPLLYQTAIRTRSFSVRGVRGDEDSLSHGSTGSPPTMDIPEENSTSPYHLVPESPGVQSRILPRSPLCSPDSRPEVLLTSLPGHNTGVEVIRGEFSGQSFRRRNRTFRHQTNSFSFDDSVRASAAYEQDRISSTSTTDSITRPREHVTLQEELRGSYVINRRFSSAELSAATGVQEEHQNVLDKSVSRRTHAFPSAELPLPPPFSTVSRTASTAGSLPSLHDQNPRDQSASSVKEDTRTRPKERTESVASPSLNNRRSVEHVNKTALDPTSSGCPSPVSLLSSAGRLISSCRSRSSFGVTSPSPSPTPRRNQADGPSRMPDAQTPSRTYQVYNDQLSPMIQPQTPAHLPESRHRSRFHPSYTAPVTRTRARFYSINSGHGGIHNTPSPQSGHSSATPSRRGTAAGSRSPAGLLNHGFQGLYGGRENGDEEQNWVDGVRFSSAEVRLWETRDEQDGRTLRDTPERELWRIGRG